MPPLGIKLSRLRRVVHSLMGFLSKYMLSVICEIFRSLIARFPCERTCYQSKQIPFASIHSL